MKAQTKLEQNGGSTIGGFTEIKNFIRLGHRFWLNPV